MKEKRGIGKRGQVRREVVLWVIALIGLVILGYFAYLLYTRTPSEFCHSKRFMGG